MGFQIRVLQRFGREGVAIGEIPSHDCAFRAAQGLKVWLRDVGREVIGRKRSTINEDIYVIALLEEFDCIYRG